MTADLNTAGANMTGTDRNAANSGWQPIDTADKDAGRLFLGVVRSGRLEEIHIGFFDHAVNEDEVSCWWSEQCDDEITPHVWMPFVDIPLPLPALTTPGGTDDR